MKNPTVDGATYELAYQKIANIAAPLNGIAEELKWRVNTNPEAGAAGLTVPEIAGAHVPSTWNPDKNTLDGVAHTIMDNQKTLGYIKKLEDKLEGK